jgi:precorrin-2/cobalt-factor-2 C20-methyltransferase
MPESERRPGCLYGVGVGPGDPELLTLKALKILERVVTIFVPQKNRESEGFARSIITSQVKDSERKIIGLEFPMLRDERKLEPYWDRAADQIWAGLSTGEDCAFINIGDPLLYGTFIHALRTIQRKHPGFDVRVIPGISSINSAAAATVFPLASNDERLAVLSGGQDEDFIRETLRNFDTVVFMKVNSVFDRVVSILEEMELLDKSVYVRRSSTMEEEIVTDIKRLKGSKPDYFSILLVRREKW